MSAHFDGTIKIWNEVFKLLSQISFGHMTFAFIGFIDHEKLICVSTTNFVLLQVLELQSL